MVTEKLRRLVEDQCKGHENEDIWMVGEQLLDMAEREPIAAELLEKDLAIPEMGLSSAAKKLKEYADKNHGKKQCFCITPKVAEGILRDFYGIPVPTEVAEQAPAEEERVSGFIDLDDFL